jgi:hypothetical protein
MDLKADDVAKIELEYFGDVQRALPLREAYFHYTENPFDLREVHFDDWYQVVDKLVHGEVFATAYTHPLSPSSQRVLIKGELWPLLKPDIHKGTAKGGGLKLLDVWIQEEQPTESDSSNLYHPIKLSPNKDYSVVRTGDIEFKFGVIQSVVVEQLHRASMTSDPWRVGKQLLAEAGAKSKSLGDIFRRTKKPSWRELIEHDGRGRYRIRSMRGAPSAPTS